jgi:hypothetical protein
MEPCGLASPYKLFILQRGIILVFRRPQTLSAKEFTIHWQNYESICCVYLFVHLGEFGSGFAGDVTVSTWAAASRRAPPPAAMTMPTTDWSASTEPAWLEWLPSPADTIFVGGRPDDSCMRKLTWVAASSRSPPPTAMAMPPTDWSGSTDPMWLEWLPSPPDRIFVGGGPDVSYIGKLQMSLTNPLFRLLSTTT